MDAFVAGSKTKADPHPQAARQNRAQEKAACSGRDDKFAGNA
jgi:hypothetical protein